MPAAFTFPPPPPPPPKAAPVESFRETPAFNPSNSRGDGRQHRGRGQNHNTGRGRGQNHRGSRLTGHDPRGGRGNAANHGPGDGNSFHYQRQDGHVPITTAPNSGTAGYQSIMSMSQGGGDQTQPADMQQQCAAYTAAAQMMWHSPGFQASYSQAQTNLSNRWPATTLEQSQGAYGQDSQQAYQVENIPSSAPRNGLTHRENLHKTYRKDRKPTMGRGLSTANKPQVKQRVAVAPAVPSFGFSLPTPVSSPNRPTDNTKHNNKNKRRKTTHLGLIHDKEPQYSSEEEDIDEESRWAGPVGPITIEHGGRVVKLTTAAEIAAWKAERRREFPTQARVEQRKQEAAEMRERLLRLQRGASPPPVVVTGVAVKDFSDGASTQAKDRLKELESLRRRVQESEEKRRLSTSTSQTPATLQTSSNPLRCQDSRPTIGLNLDYASDEDDEEEEGENTNVNEDIVDENNTGISDAASIVSSSSVLSSSCSDDLSDSDSAAPEVLSTKPAQPIPVPPPARKVQPQLRVCHNFRQKGRCHMGSRCKFAHPDHLKREMEPLKKARVTLHQRWVAQEQEEANKLALEAIKYLGQKGFLT